MMKIVELSSGRRKKGHLVVLLIFIMFSNLGESYSTRELSTRRNGVSNAKINSIIEKLRRTNQLPTTDRKIRENAKDPINGRIGVIRILDRQGIYRLKKVKFLGDVAKLPSKVLRRNSNIRKARQGYVYPKPALPFPIADTTRDTEDIVSRPPKPPPVPVNPERGFIQSNRLSPIKQTTTSTPNRIQKFPDIRDSIPGEPYRDYNVLSSIPKTSFTCQGKIPGFYADPETGCQAFHRCSDDPWVIGTYRVTMDSFLCPNGSLFNQQVYTCDWWANVNCKDSSRFYVLNRQIGKLEKTPYGLGYVKFSGRRIPPPPFYKELAPSIIPVEERKPLPKELRNSVETLKKTTITESSGSNSGRNKNIIRVLLSQVPNLSVEENLSNSIEQETSAVGVDGTNVPKTSGEISRIVFGAVSSGTRGVLNENVSSNRKNSDGRLVAGTRGGADREILKNVNLGIQQVGKTNDVGDRDGASPDASSLLSLQGIDYYDDYSDEDEAPVDYNNSETALREAVNRMVQAILSNTSARAEAFRSKTTRNRLTGLIVQPRRSKNKSNSSSRDRKLKKPGAEYGLPNNDDKISDKSQDNGSTPSYYKSNDSSNRMYASKYPVSSFGVNAQNTRTDFFTGEYGLPPLSYISAPQNQYLRPVYGPPNLKSTFNYDQPNRNSYNTNFNQLAGQNNNNENFNYAQSNQPQENYANNRNNFGSGFGTYNQPNHQDPNRNFLQPGSSQQNVESKNFQNSEAYFESNQNFQHSLNSHQPIFMSGNVNQIKSINSKSNNGFQGLPQTTNSLLPSQKNRESFRSITTQTNGGSQNNFNTQGKVENQPKFLSTQSSRGFTNSKILPTLRPIINYQEQNTVKATESSYRTKPNNNLKNTEVPEVILPATNARIPDLYAIKLSDYNRNAVDAVTLRKSEIGNNQNQRIVSTTNAQQFDATQRGTNQSFFGGDSDKLNNLIRFNFNDRVKTNVDNLGSFTDPEPTGQTPPLVITPPPIQKYTSFYARNKKRSASSQMPVQNLDHKFNLNSENPSVNCSLETDGERSQPLSNKINFQAPKHFLSIVKNPSMLTFYHTKPSNSK